MQQQKILIDLLKLKHIHTGLGQVCLAYGRELSKLNNPRFRFTFLLPRNFYGYFGNNVDYLHPSLKYRCFPGLRTVKFDLWHSTNQDVVFFPAKGTCHVLTIHDLNFIYEKTHGKIKRRKRILNALLQRVSQVVAISNYTKEDVVRYLQLQSPIKVIYNGVDTNTSVNVERPDFMGEYKFFLTVGVFKPNKNYTALIDLMENYPDKYLVMAGDHTSSYGQSLIKKIFNKGLQDRIIAPGKINEADKIWLYAHCEALLFPSINEGMGLPIIEAMRFGKPVIASNLSCLPEFGGQYAYYFDSFDPLDMRNTIEQSLSDFQEHPERKWELKKYAEQFSWEKNTRQYIQLFEELLALS